MENLIEKYTEKVQIYLRKKSLETAVKKRREKVEAMVRGLILDKTTSQSISMLNEVIELFDEKMDERLKIDLESVEAISNHKKI